LDGEQGAFSDIVSGDDEGLDLGMESDGVAPQSTEYEIDVDDEMTGLDATGSDESCF